jgi:hypothetical protein
MSTSDGCRYYEWSSPSGSEKGRTWKSKILRGKTTEMLFQQQQLAAILILVGSICASRVKATAIRMEGHAKWHVASRAW